MVLYRFINGALPFHKWCSTVSINVMFADTYQNAGPGQCLIKSTQSSLCGWIPFKHSHVMMSKLSEEVKTGKSTLHLILIFF